MSRDLIWWYSVSLTNGMIKLYPMNQNDGIEFIFLVYLMRILTDKY